MLLRPGLALVFALMLAVMVVGPRSMATSGQGIVGEPGGEPEPGVLPEDEGPEPTGDLVAPGPKPDLVLLSTGRVVGYVEPCGCPRNPAGGLARRAGYRDLLAGRYPDTPVLFVDTGDFSGDPDEAGRYKTRNMLDGMGMLGLSVSNVGERELADGIGAFLDRIHDQTVNYTSASFVYRDTGDPLLSPFVIREVPIGAKGTLKVGFVGVNAFNPAYARPAGDGRVVVTLPAADALEVILPRAKDLAEMTVLLANMGVRDLTELLRTVSGIDLVFASDGERISPGGVFETIEGVPVLYAGDQGKRLGEVRIFRDGPAGGLRYQEGHVWLTRRYPPDPEIQSLIDSTIAHVNEINRERAEQVVVPAGARAFLTGDTCEPCHAEEHEIWSLSGHAHAYQTLRNVKQDFNPECVKCHVTGFNAPGGFVNGRVTPQLTNVQCEACHGDATGHPENPEKPYGDTPPRTCFVCHTEENSPDFVFFPYWNKIRH